MRYLYLALAFAIPSLSFSQSAARLKIWLDPITEQLLLQEGFELDHGVHKKGVFFISDFTAEEHAFMKASGIQYEVLIPNVSEYYAKRIVSGDAHRAGRASCGEAPEEVETPEDFDLGSMGGFYTYNEFVSHLDNMAATYPNLITTKAPIDTFLTHESRPIYWLKISDNPTVNENEPEVLYTAIHHAREPESLTQLIFFMYYILENYGADDDITALIDNTELYFIPMINPDGYAWNETTEPNGGGLWRKNRRNNGDGTMGVDLNRNYGFEWGYDNDGSSPSSNSQTYRGPSAFSEPETRAVKWFCEQHEFALALNYHSFGNYLIYPWGYVPQLTPDSTTFITFAQEMTSVNNYVYGTGFETVAYAVNGDSDDWMYGEQTSKNKIFSMTPEVGNSGDGFWPAQNRIELLAKENVRPNLLLGQYAGDYARITDQSPQLLTSTSGSIAVELQRLGLQFDPDYSFYMEAVSANASVISPTEVYSAMNHLEVYNQSFVYELDANIQQGDVVEFDLVASFGDYQTRQRITKIFGQPTTALANAGNDTTDFVTDAWGVTGEDFVSPSTSITDSPNDNYDNNTYSEILYNRVIDLRQSMKGLLTFQARWEIEGGYDYVQLMASPVSEENWSPLCGLYTKTGTSFQDDGQPLWDGIQNAWVQEQVDLSDYLGQRIKLKFRLVSDAFVNFDGFYVDDLEFITLLDQNSTLPLDTGSLDSLIGIASAGMPAEWKLYPNPASDRVVIESAGMDQGHLRIYNIQGQLVESSFIRVKTALNTADYEPGIYLLEIASAKGTYRQRLLVVR